MVCIKRLYNSYLAGSIIMVTLHLSILCPLWFLLQKSVDKVSPSKVDLIFLGVFTIFCFAYNYRFSKMIIDGYDTKMIVHPIVYTLANFVFAMMSFFILDVSWELLETLFYGKYTIQIIDLFIRLFFAFYMAKTITLLIFTKLESKDLDKEEAIEKEDNPPTITIGR